MYSPIVWLVLGGIGAAFVLGFLYMLASMVRNDQYVHRLKISVQQLKIAYVEEVRRLQGENEIIDVDVIDDGPNAVPGAPKAADDALPAEPERQAA